MCNFKFLKQFTELNLDFLFIETHHFLQHLLYITLIPYEYLFVILRF